MTDQPAIIEKHEKLLRRIAYKLGSEYDLRPDAFSISFHPAPVKAVKIEGGIRPHIIFSVWLDDPEFEYWLRDALQQVEIVKRCGAIDVRSRLNERDAMVRELLPHIVAKPRVDARDVEVKLVRRVVMTHRRTGMVATREAEEGSVTWTRLLRLAGEELHEYVEVADRLRKKDETPAQTNQPA